MSEPKSAMKHTNAFFGTSLLFLGICVLWNIGNLAMLDISVQDRYTLGMGVVAAMFATVVVSKVVRDREEASEFVAEVQRARYEEVLAKAPAPGLGNF